MDVELWIHCGIKNIAYLLHAFNQFNLKNKKKNKMEKIKTDEKENVQ